MDFKQIKELISLINTTEITDLELEQDGFKLRIRKEKKVLNLANPVTLPQIQPTSVMEASSVTSPEPHRDSGLMEFTAPMVGTFYRAPAPDAAPYIQVGDTIEEGQVLFIIEAMKMMNEIVAEGGGVVKEFLVENGQPVEFGQPVLLIDPLG